MKNTTPLVSHLLIACLFFTSPIKGYATTLNTPKPHGQIHNQNQSPVLIRGPQVSAINYQSFLNTHSRYITYSSYLERNLVPTNLMRDIETHFLKAQKHLIAQSLGPAKKHFQWIISKAYKADWPLAQRQLIHYSFFRLSELARSPSKKIQFLKQALYFSTLLKPDENSIPAAVIKAYKEVKSQLDWLHWNPYETHKSFDSVLINGHFYKLHPQTSLLIPLGKVRVTLLSNGLKHKTKILMGQQLLYWAPLEEDIVSGVCKDFENSYPVPVNSSVLFPNDCVGEMKTLKNERNRINNKLSLPPSLAQRRYLPNSLDRSTMETSLHRDPLGSSRPPSFSSPPSQKNLAQVPHEQSSLLKETPLFKNKWFWVGAFVMSTGLLLWTQRSSRRNSGGGSSPQTESLPPTGPPLEGF